MTTPNTMIDTLNDLGQSLPLQLDPNALTDGDLPTTHEMLHWSSRLTHGAIAIGIAVGVALVLHWLIFAFVRRIARRSEDATPLVAAAQPNQSIRWSMVAFALGIAGDADHLVDHIWTAIEPFASPALMGWVIYALVKTFAELLAERAERGDDEMTARSRRTRIALLSRVIGVVIIFITLSLMLMVIPSVRHVGTTLMASAGLIGLAVGAAAQPALKSLIAGIQIAITQPIRIGDFVMVEGEQGRVEDIRFSYVVIRTPDERRLIVPTTKFLDASFQNWTRVGGITGSVILPLRPGFPIQPVRAAYQALLAKHAQWDGRTGDCQVAEARVGSVDIKLVMSAEDPAALGALRLAIREDMLEWLREEMPEALCKTA